MTGHHCLPDESATRSIYKRPMFQKSIVMQWNRRYRFKSYVRSSLWLIPLIAIPVGLLASRLSHWLDVWLGWRFLDLAVPGATALFQTVVTRTYHLWFSRSARCWSPSRLPAGS